jgi:DNA-binding NarL/FixJ family response regulator
MMPSREELSSDFVSIAVADSTRIHTQLLADALRNDRGLQVVAAASNSEELLGAISRVPIDVVVIAHNLDNRSGHGTELLREIRSLRSQIKGVILMDGSKPEDVLECFRAGARGIFSKQERIESLCKCIRSVHDGQVWARSVDLDHALDALAASPLVRATNHKGIELLSARERQVIQHVAGGMTNREIAKALNLSSHTVKNYLFRIFDKLGVSSRTELLYLTMNHSKATGATSDDGPVSLSTVVEAAGEGDVSSQLLLAEHFSRLDDGLRAKNGDRRTEPDPVAAYMWYLLAEKNLEQMAGQVESGKNNIRQTMSPQQIADAETRAAAWSKTTKKQSGFAVADDRESNDPQKHRAAAR